jgi:uncharacterized protein (DUF433 family)
MRLENYFDFLGSEEIRIRGSRIGIESVLDAYLHGGQSAEEIAGRFPTLTLEQVYATILYYLHERPAVEGYLARWAEYCRSAEEAYDRDPPSVVTKLRTLNAARPGKDAAA